LQAITFWWLAFCGKTMLFIDLCIQGLIQGAIYALIALGLTLVYGLLRILHVAHAALFTLGGYIGVIVTNGSGSFLLALVTAMLIVGVVGLASYRVIYKPLLNRMPLIALIASIGVFIASEELFRILFGAYGLSYNTPPLKGQIEILPGIPLSHARILVVVLAVGLLSGIGWMAVHTRMGIAARATVVDPEMAASSGVNVETIRYATFFIGSAFAGAAGVMVSLLNNLVEPTMGAVPSYKALAIIVLGGLGSVRGALIASLALGIIESFGTIYVGDFLDRDSIAFAFLIMILMIRPQGLLVRS
jgi:branched-chain amino acid transport system permease protein